MNKATQSPGAGRKYPGLVEKAVPIALVVIALAIVLLLVIILLVALGQSPGASLLAV